MRRKLQKILKELTPYGDYNLVQKSGFGFAVSNNYIVKFPEEELYNYVVTNEKAYLDKLRKGKVIGILDRVDLIQQLEIFLEHLKTDWVKPVVNLSRLGMYMLNTISFKISYDKINIAFGNGISSRTICYENTINPLLSEDFVFLITRPGVIALINILNNSDCDEVYIYDDSGTRTSLYIKECEYPIRIIFEASSGGFHPYYTVKNDCKISKDKQRNTLNELYFHPSPIDTEVLFDKNLFHSVIRENLNLSGIGIKFTSSDGTASFYNLDNRTKPLKKLFFKQMSNELPFNEETYIFSPINFDNILNFIHGDDMILSYGTENNVSSLCIRDNEDYYYYNIITKMIL